MSIDTLVENYFAPKGSLTKETLWGMFDEVVSELGEQQRIFEARGAKERERVLRLPNVIPTEISVGQKPASEDRQQFELWMSNIGMGGGSGESAVAAKIQTITKFFENPEAHLAEATIPQTLSYLMFLNQFVWMLKEFNASVAGFLWEPFLAALFGGKSRQVPTSEGDIADIQIQTADGLSPISLKILSETGEVKGSFTDLVKHFAEGGAEMRYVVVTKQQSGKEKAISSATFWEFNITADNFFDWIGHVAHVEKLILIPKNFTLSAVNKKAFLKTGGAGKSTVGKPGQDGYIWIRHAVGGRKTSGGSVMAARADWLRLADVRKPGVITIDPTTAEAINLQGIPEDGVVQWDTPLSAEIADYKGGGSAKGVAPGAKVATEYEAMPGEDTRDTTKLWGGHEKLAEWSALAQQLNSPQQFFQAVQGKMEGVEKAAGYGGGGGGGQQFHIKSGHYTKMGKRLGILKITSQRVEAFFKEAAEKMNDDLILMFNSLASLTDNIGRFFLVDCGGDKCTDRDAAKRNQAGNEAMADAAELERTVESSVRTSGER